LPLKNRVLMIFAYFGAIFFWLVRGAPLAFFSPFAFPFSPHPSLESCRSPPKRVFPLRHSFFLDISSRTAFFQQAPAATRVLPNPSWSRPVGCFLFTERIRPLTPLSEMLPPYTPPSSPLQEFPRMDFLSQQIRFFSAFRP